MPFWIDTDGYTDRDRDMFVAGFEFQMVYRLIQDGCYGSRPIHRENESRIRMMCGRMGIKCTITQIEGFDEWSQLTIEAP